MKKIFLLLFSVLFLLGDNLKVDSLSLRKVKKLVLAQEDMAYEFKKFLLNGGANLNSKLGLNISSISEKYTNPFYSSDFILSIVLEKMTTTHPNCDEQDVSGDNTVTGYCTKVLLQTSNTSSKNLQLVSREWYSTHSKETLPSTLKPNIYDYYYSNKHRKYTQINAKNEVEIVFSKQEKFILNHNGKGNNSLIVSNDTADKLVLGQKGLLYTKKGGYDFYYDGKVLILKNPKIATDKNAILNKLKNTYKFFYPGLKIIQENEDGKMDEYITLDDDIIKVDNFKPNYIPPSPIPQEPATKISQEVVSIINIHDDGGGFIKNGDLYVWGNNKNQAIGIKKKTNLDKMITVPIKIKTAKYRYTKTSMKRPYFIDFDINVNDDVSLAAIDDTGAVYTNFGADVFERTSRPTNNTFELQKSSFFDGYIYTWGSTSGAMCGLAGNGNKSKTEYYPIEKTVSSIKFKQIVSLRRYKERRIVALGEDKKIYMWGAGNSCTENPRPFASFSATKLTSQTIEGDGVGQKILSIKGNDYASIVTEAENGMLYYVNVYYFANAGYVYSYDENHPKYIGFVDYSFPDIVCNDGASEKKVRIYVSKAKDYKLDGSYFNGGHPCLPTEEEKNKIQNAKIEWRQIRTVSQKGAFCGLDKYNQLYCWGKMFGNETNVLPIFNANISDKIIVNKSKIKDIKVQYPTYIGGFNHAVKFK